MIPAFSVDKPGRQIVAVRAVRRLIFPAISILCLIFLTTSACSLSKMASDITSNIMLEGAPVMEQESDPYVAETSGLALLKTLEVFAYHNPNNDRYRTLLAKNYANYAFGFLENKLLKYEGVDPARYETTLRRAKDFYVRGKKYGLSVLKEKSGFSKALTSDMETFEKAVRKISRNKMAPLFWTAFAWGGWINLSKDSPTAIVDLGKVERMMARAAEINNTFFYGGPHLFYGVYYGSRPPMLGGNMEKSKEHFEKAVKVTHDRFLFAKVLYAQFYCVQSQELALFRQLLGEVMAADPNILPEQRLANILAQERAQTLLGHEKRYFASASGY